jgi:RNA polymerase sigma-70 factor (ECF subfamily)
VYRLVGREADAADCFQNVFVSALEYARKQTVENWPALLQRLATARSLECLRRRYRTSDRMTGPLESDPADSREDGPASEAAGRELAAELRQALAEIDERQSQVFCLSCLDGRTYREIAEQLGVTVNHVGVLLNRARSELRERLRAFHPASDAEPAQREASR